MVQKQPKVDFHGFLKLATRPRQSHARLSPSHGADETHGRARGPDGEREERHGQLAPGQGRVRRPPLPPERDGAMQGSLRRPRRRRRAHRPGRSRGRRRRRGGDSQAVDGAQGRGHPRNVRQRRAARGQPQAHQRLPEGRGAGGRVHRRRRRRRRRGRGGSGRRGVARAGSGPLRGDEIHAGGGRRSGATRAAPGRGRHAPLRGHLHQGRRARRRRRPRRRFRAIRAADAPSAPRAHGPPRRRHPADPHGERPVRRCIEGVHRARAVARGCPRTRPAGRGGEEMRREPGDVRCESADGGVRRRRRGPVHRGARRVGQAEATDGVRADGGRWWWDGPAEERDGGGGNARVFGFAGAIRGARWRAGCRASCAPAGVRGFGGWVRCIVGRSRRRPRVDGMDERARRSRRRERRRAVSERRVAGRRRRSPGYRVRRPLRRGNLRVPFSRAGRVRGWEGPEPRAGRQVSVIRARRGGRRRRLCRLGVGAGWRERDGRSGGDVSLAGVPSGPVPLRADEPDRHGRRLGGGGGVQVRAGAVFRFVSGAVCERLFYG